MRSSFSPIWDITCEAKWHTGTKEIEIHFLKDLNSESRLKTRVSTGLMQVLGVRKMTLIV